MLTVNKAHPLSKIQVFIFWFQPFQKEPLQLQEFVETFII